MESQKVVKPKRQKKKKSRTEVFSEDSESESEVKKGVAQEKKGDSVAVPVAPESMTDAEVSAAFAKYYMRRATTEFAEDLDRVRGADDFKDEALSVLIGALKQGTDGFSIEEKRRVVTAGMKEEKKGVEE